MANKTLREAKDVKNDEFYTQFSEIQREINAYLEYNPNVFKGKTILLPCDDPEWSNFTKFFAQNFERFGLKKLISTSYAIEQKEEKYNLVYQLSLFETESPKFDVKKTKSHGKIFTLVRDENSSGRIDIDDLKWDYLEGDGDFRSEEIKKLRDEADIIITNPPFSMFRQFVNWIMEANKDFIIMGNKNAISYKEIFPYLMENKMWVGSTSLNGGRWMIMPDGIKIESSSAKKNEYGQILVNIPGVCWFTNVEHGKRHQKLELMTMDDNVRYSKHKEIRNIGYKKYDNYDAIEVNYVDSIPKDYKGLIGVPVTFMERYNPDQFDIIGFFNNYKPETANKYQIYGDAVKVTSTTSLFRGPVVNGKALYFRIIIKFKEVVNENNS